MNYAKITAILALIVISASAPSFANVYYVAVNGSDKNPGTAEKPFATITKAVYGASAGDTIWVHGGTYTKQKEAALSQSGFEKAPIRLSAVQGEKPILDFTGESDCGLLIKGAWWHLKGLTITHAGDGGIRITGKSACHNVLENVTTCANGDTGLHITEGAADNTILNCDSCLNYDPQHQGENADGFAAKFDVGTGNRFIGCRSWSNSDDGYDCWHAGQAVRFENCFAWRNGENIWNNPDFTGDGNGFKLGQMEGSHILIRCAAWNQPARGFDLNGNSSGVKVINCTSVRSAKNFAFTFIQGNAEKNVLRNNLSFEGKVSVDERVDDKQNSWNIPGVNITEDDFLSLDSSALEGPRQADGSLPECNFLHLAPNSDAVDAGVDMGLPYHGAAPDLGAFECLVAKP